MFPPPEYNAQSVHHLPIQKLVDANHQAFEKPLCGGIPLIEILPRMRQRFRRLRIFRKLTNVRFIFVFFRSCYIMLPPILQEVSEKNSLVVISGLNSGLP